MTQNERSAARSASGIDLDKALLAGLLGPEHQGRYMANAWFKAHVDELAKFARVLVDGLALRADAENTKLRERLAAIEKGPVMSQKERSAT